MSIALVDINQLTATVSKDKLMELAVDEPNGIGGFNIKSITKENLFKLLGMSIDFETGVGANDILTFGGNEKIIFINNGGTGGFLIRVGFLGVSSDGMTNAVQMDTSGNLRIGSAGLDGSILFYEDGTLYSYTARDLEQDVYVDDNILNGGTSIAVEARNSIMVVGVAASGTIASHTIQFPALARVGYVFEFRVIGTITALTLTASETIVNPLTSAVNSGGRFVRVVTGAGPFVASWRRLSLYI